MRPPDQTRRRLIGGLGAVGVAAAIGSLVRVLGDPQLDAPTPTAGRLPSTVSRSSPATTARATPTTTAPAPAVSGPPSTTAMPPISVAVVCRDAWGADPARSGMEVHDPIRLTLHHTAVSQTSSVQGPARARQHQRYHRSLGWPDLAYHFLVDRTGLAYEGRDVAFRGDTATEYDPSGHFLVCMEGDFDDQEPTVRQIETTVNLFAWASQEFGIAADSLAGHGDFADTSCPGASAVVLLPSMAEAVSRSAPVSIDRRCGPDGDALVAAVEASG